MPDFGLIRGDVSCASVRVSSVILKLQMEAQGTEKTIEYLMNQAESYFRDCDWIDAREYGEAHTETGGVGLRQNNGRVSGGNNLVDPFIGK